MVYMLFPYDFDLIDTGSIHDFQENIKKVVRFIEHS